MEQQQEVAVAEELAADRLARGERSDYRFLVADGPDGALLGYACYGRTPCTRAAWVSVSTTTARAPESASTHASCSAAAVS